VFFHDLNCIICCYWYGVVGDSGSPCPPFENVILRDFVVVEMNQHLTGSSLIG
jgi:hypothetical protein